MVFASCWSLFVVELCLLLVACRSCIVVGCLSSVVLLLAFRCWCLWFEVAGRGLLFVVRRLWFAVVWRVCMCCLLLLYVVYCTLFVVRCLSLLYVVGWCRYCSFVVRCLLVSVFVCWLIYGCLCFV